MMRKKNRNFTFRARLSSLVSGWDFSRNDDICVLSLVVVGFADDIRDDVVVV